MSAIVTLTLRDDEKTLKTKHLVTHEFTISHDDPFLSQLISELEKEFVGKPTDCFFNIKYTP